MHRTMQDVEDLHGAARWNVILDTKATRVVNVKKQAGFIAPGTMRAADRIFADLLECCEEQTHLVFVRGKPAVEGAIEKAVGTGATYGRMPSS